ncbi:BtrH N-terminal domain-containing protein [Streptomyces sp. G5(2025)]|uniref:BtrH N-terminal domain-containing protein n=1 Tax=Streptomyces sp. G5(2025) TaxID=3406628 RepID=UPI003C1361F5
MIDLSVRRGEFTSLDCITATYGHVLVTLGYDPSVLGADWGYHPVELPESEWPVERFAFHRRSFEKTLLDWYGINSELIQHQDTNAVEKYLRERLGRNEPVIVLVDAFHLPHSSNYHLQHHAHRIVVHSDEGPEFAIIDRYRGSLFEGVIGAPELLSAMSSEALAEGRRGDPDWRNRTICVSSGSPGDRPSYATSAHAAIVQNTEPAATLSGTTALRTCAGQLRAAPEAYATLSPAGMIEVSAWFGELASQRALNARFLRAAVAAGVPGLTEGADAADDLSRHWERTRNYFFLRFRTGVSAVLRISDLLEEAAALEADWNESIRKAMHGASADVSPGKSGQ